MALNIVRPVSDRLVFEFSRFGMGVGAKTTAGHGILHDGFLFSFFHGITWFSICVSVRGVIWLVSRYRKMEPMEHLAQVVGSIRDGT